MTAMTNIQIQVGELAFSFDSFQQWVQKSRAWHRHMGLTSVNSIAIDATGRICSLGRDFERANREATYPVTVYELEPRSDYQLRPERVRAAETEREYRL